MGILVVISIHGGLEQKKKHLFGLDIIRKLRMVIMFQNQLDGDFKMNKDFKKLFDEIEAIYKNCSREELLDATIVSVMFIFYNGYTQEDILNFSKHVMKES